MLFKQILLLCALALIATRTARADDVSGLPASQSEKELQGDAAPDSFLGRYGKANYLAWLTGPRTEGLSGNKGGTGTNLEIRHYPTLGGKFNETLSLVFTPQFTQYYNPKPQAEQRHFAFDNPYFTLEDSKLWKNELYGLNLDAYLRFYLPVSRLTHDESNVGFLPPDLLAANDNGNGEIRLFINPTKTFLDGKLTLSGAMLANVKFARLSAEQRIARQQASLDNLSANTALIRQQNGLDTDYVPNGTRENLYVFFDPVVTYSVSSKVDAYLEYSSGYLHHSTDGHWTSTNNSAEGRYFSPGIYWAAAKGLSVNPYISWGPVFEGLSKADLGLQVTYTFL
jgi:hypothetical protein